jgi:hypothetical protein
MITFRRALLVGLCVALAARLGLGLDHAAALLLGLAGGSFGGLASELHRGE